MIQLEANVLNVVPSDVRGLQAKDNFLRLPETQMT